MNKCMRFRFGGREWLLNVSRFNGRISVGCNGSLQGEFWAVDDVVWSIQEWTRWKMSVPRLRKLSRRRVEMIEDFIREFPNTWLGN